MSAIEERRERARQAADAYWGGGRFLSDVTVAGSADAGIIEATQVRLTDDVLEMVPMLTRSDALDVVSGLMNALGFEVIE